METRVGSGVAGTLLPPVRDWCHRVEDYPVEPLMRELERDGERQRAHIGAVKEGLQSVVPPHVFESIEGNPKVAVERLEITLST